MQLLPFFNPGVVQVVHRDDDRLVLLVHAVIDDDFKRMARQKGWEYIAVGEPPEPYTAYEVFGQRTCDEVERRANTNNPWWAFDDSNKWP